MRKLASAVFALMLLALSFPKVADVAPVEWLGRITGMGGATSESWRRKNEAAGSAHGLGYAEALGVIPLFGPLGLQLQASYDGGNGHRFDASGGPIFDFGMGKAGVFMQGQYRLSPADKHQSHEFNRIRNWWITPALSLYDIIPGTNIDIWYRQPLTGEYQRFSQCCSDGERGVRLYPYSQTRLAVNFFPATPFLAKDNLELTLGVQLNGLSGPAHENVALGVGPVFGMAFMPLPALEVTLFKAAIDNHNRYRVTSGVQFYLARGNQTLLQLRRKYLEPTNLPGPVSSFFKVT